MRNVQNCNERTYQHYFVLSTNRPQLVYQHEFLQGRELSPIFSRNEPTVYSTPSCPVLEGCTLGGSYLNRYARGVILCSSGYNALSSSYSSSSSSSITLRTIVVTADLSSDGATFASGKRSSFSRGGSKRHNAFVSVCLSNCSCCSASQ